MNFQWLRPVWKTVEKHLPKALVIIGVGGVVTGTVVACCETTKLPPVIEEGKKKKEEIRKTVAEDQQKKELFKADLQTGWEVTKLYFPSALIVGLSLTSLVGSNLILQKKNLALAATVTTLDASFKEYRSRVADKYGEDAENDIMLGAKEVEVTTVDENGVEKTVTHRIADPNLASPYAFYFDKKSLLYNKLDNDMNATTLSIVESTLNDRFIVMKVSKLGDPNGEFITLNDLFFDLGMPKTKTGQFVGWRKHEGDPGESDGDGYISLRWHLVERLDELGEWESVYVCDPNVEVLFPEDN